MGGFKKNLWMPPSIPLTMGNTDYSAFFNNDRKEFSLTMKFSSPTTKSFSEILVNVV